MLTTCDCSTEIDRTKVEDRIHREFWAAFAAWEEAPEEQKAEASVHLNKTVRQLYDFIVRGKVPQESPRRAAAGSFN